MKKPVLIVMMSVCTFAICLTDKLSHAEDVQPAFERYVPMPTAQSSETEVKKQVNPVIIPRIQVPVELASPQQQDVEFKKFSFDDNINNTNKPVKLAKIDNKKPESQAKVPLKKSVSMSLVDKSVKSDNKVVGTAAKKDQGDKYEVVETLQETIKELKDSKVLAIIERENTQTVDGSYKTQAKTVYAYLPGSLYQVWMKPEFITDIQLAVGEQLISVMGGDTVRWIVGDTTSGSGDTAQTHVLIKPLQAGLSTNFVITTDKHTYQLKAISTKNTYNPTVCWTYPIEERNTLIAIKKEQRKLDEQIITSQPIAPSDINFDYKIKCKVGLFGKEYKWTPKRVFDDGSKTYIQASDMMDKTESPALFIKDANGNLNLVNYRLNNNYFVIDRLFSEAELRNGIDEIVTISKNN